MAKNIMRKIGKAIIVILTVMFWWIGFASLATPYLILLLVFASIFWLIVKPRYALLSLLALIVGYKQISVVFAWHMNAGFTKQKEESNLRIVDWNVESFNGLTKNKNTKRLIRNEVAASILKLQPDVICLQEFNHAYAQGPQADNLALFSSTHPYYYFSRDYKRDAGGYYSGCIIFSRYPIIDSGKFKYPKAESLIFIDLLKGNDTIRIYTTHLQSFKFKKDDYDDIEKIKEQDEALSASRNIFKKMIPAFKRRGTQADIVKTMTSKNRFPSVICGDFNDVPNSYTYFRIKGDRQDAFLKKDFGIGRTFIDIAPTLRIDYILPDNKFEVSQFDMVDEDLSDHIMLVADLRLKQ
ncbi:endonuclease/exonuclease/phosphatase [Russula earlei]|uniref:Endonuclease/exonuclease/phosphatase n=1 Tax=Russula earlei TaxID=71964 RepID=A0ACC0TSK5_9AGAM|nr:endonuclease/exonuclease/phosphatase [Russula earlei]